MKCEAKQYSDTMICDKCGLVWDTNDPYPPACEELEKHWIKMVWWIMFLFGIGFLAGWIVS